MRFVRQNLTITQARKRNGKPILAWKEARDEAFRGYEMTKIFME
jgi:hypothetical protein